MHRNQYTVAICSESHSVNLSQSHAIVFVTCISEIGGWIGEEILIQLNHNLAPWTSSPILYDSATAKLN